MTNHGRILFGNPAKSQFMLTYLLIALGGGLGSVARFWLSENIAARFDSPFPWGTLAVNLTGCFAIGLLAVYTGAGSRPFNHE